MLRLIYIILLWAVLIPASISQVIVVDHAGGGDYTIIQEGIEASNNGDTVLVYPGTYYENINFNGKNITLGSLNLTTGNPSYICQTIIDGNQNNSCVRINSGETDVIIYGLTLQNGGGNNKGGGIFFEAVNVKIYNCRIINNFNIREGGGMYIRNFSEVFLSGTTIAYNSSYSIGGGVCVVSGSVVIFDTISLCNIYLNYAVLGGDIHKTCACPPVNVVVDTFTVVSPDHYYLSSINEQGFQMFDYTYEIQNQKIVPVNADLYVNANAGNDSNSGLTPDDPLKSVSFALTKIISDSTHTNTIHIANGVYSPALTNEKYPLNLRSFISFVGESQDSTIMDADSLIYLMRGSNLTKNLIFENLTIRNGNGYTNTPFHLDPGGIRLYINQNVRFQDVSFTKCVGDGRSVFSFKADNVVCENVDIFENYGGLPHMSVGPRYIPNSLHYHDTVNFYNCRINSNKPVDNMEFGNGGGLTVFGTYSYPNSITVNIINTEFIGNQENTPYPYGGTSALAVGQQGTAYVVNCTFGNNSTLTPPLGSIAAAFCYGHFYIYNSIFFSNTPGLIGVSATYNEPSILEVYNSLIEGGYEAIQTYGQGNIVYYDSSNINADPLWDTGGAFPYSLLSGSPCIDAGTLNLPEHIQFPEYDLAGNPRIWGNNIDMGAYEYQGNVEITEHASNISMNNLMVYPNPFSQQTNITFSVDEPGEVVVEIYNIQGRLIKTLMDAQVCQGNYTMFWKAENHTGSKGAANEYICKLLFNKKVISTRKIIQIR